MSREPIRSILARRGLAPSRDRGQNFLRDRALARTLVRDAGVGPGDAVIEIGPGLGALTAALAERAARVVALEVDAGLEAYLREEAGLPASVEVRHADALEVDLGALVDALAARSPGGAVRVVGNLPYAISAPLLRRILDVLPGLAGASLMLQKEVARRLLARPKDPGYGSLAALAALRARAEHHRDVAGRAFVPAARVISSFVTLRPRPASPLGPDEFRLFEAFVRAAFRHRRKTLANSLRETGFPAAAVERALAAQGLPAGVRAEELSPEQLFHLARRIPPAPGGGTEA